MEVPNFSSIEILNSYLRARGIDTASWGTGESKTLGHLFEEVCSGESELVETKDRKLLRLVRGVGINVFCQTRTGILKLLEEKQVFADGRIRIRNLSTSIGEKLKPGESPEEGALRALKEELKIYTEYSFSNFEERNWEVKSTSFPGLRTKNNFYITNLFLKNKDFHKKGYVERQEDKTSYYTWITQPDVPQIDN